MSLTLRLLVGPTILKRTFDYSDERLNASSILPRAVSGHPGAIPMTRFLLSLLLAGSAGSAAEMPPTWHFSSFPPPMEDTPTTVTGTFVDLRGVDRTFSEAVLIIRRDDGRLRSFPAKLLMPEDRQRAEAAEAEHRRKAARPDARTYVLAPGPYDSKTATIFPSSHFVFYRGLDRQGSGSKAFADGFLQHQAEWFERIWTAAATLGAPMPWHADPRPQKIPVFLTGTGLARHREGFAFGGENIMMHAQALGDGSTVVAHEFTHVIQFHTGGFRDSPLGGWFWECHANWYSQQILPAYPADVGVYAERAHYELTSSRHNYGSWPFLEALAEDPRFGPDFVHRIWTQNRRGERGETLEDPLQTIMRLGVAGGMWSNGPRGFGELIGNLAVRLVTWDFHNQWFIQRAMRLLDHSADRVSWLRTVLVPSPVQEGWYQPLHAHAPRAYGINLIDLVPTAPRVEIDFAGIADEPRAAGWQVTLVAVSAEGDTRTSPTVRGGKVALEVHAGERVVLAIAATPTVYESLVTRSGYGAKRRYPYLIALQGATPAPRPPGPDLRPAGGKPHPNGGGLVAASAKVEATAYVAPGAVVLDGAQVHGRARILDQAVVQQNAVVGDDAVISGGAHILGDARVDGWAHVGGWATVGDKAHLSGNATHLDYTRVCGEGGIAGDALITGFGDLHLDPKRPIGGTVLVGEDVEGHTEAAPPGPINVGQLTGLLNEPEWKDPATWGRRDGMLALWTFDRPTARVLRDVVGDADGIFSAEPKLIPCDRGGAWQMDGKIFAAAEPRLACTRQLGVEMRIWLEGRGAQWLWQVTGAEGSLQLGRREDGRAVFLLSAAERRVELVAPAKLPAGTWVRLGAWIGDHGAGLAIDGVTVATQAAPALRPDDVRPRSVLVGRDCNGRLDWVAITRCGSLPPAP